MTGDWYERGIDLDGHLMEVINFFESERESYLTRTPENDFLRIADSSAKKLLVGVESLIVPPGSSDDLFDWSAARWVAGTEVFATEVRERIQISVAEEYCTDTDKMAERCLALAEAVLASQPNEAVTRYLRRLSRCYIVGLLPECVMLCRAVLENAVAEVFDRHQEPFPVDDRGRPTMEARLERARKLGWLSDRTKRFAQDVWARGNKAVQSDPQATQDVLATIFEASG